MSAQFSFISRKDLCPEATPHALYCQFKKDFQLETKRGGRCIFKVQYAAPQSIQIIIHILGQQPGMHQRLYDKRDTIGQE